MRVHEIVLVDEYARAVDAAIHRVARIALAECKLAATHARRQTAQLLRTDRGPLKHLRRGYGAKG